MPRLIFIVIILATFVAMIVSAVINQTNAPKPIPA